MNNSDKSANSTKYQTGLTKREHFAGLAMQSFIIRYPDESDATIANEAVSFANALLAELEKGNG